MARDYTAEELRSGSQAAREREQARQEMEQTLIQQELQRGSISIISEQSITGQLHDDGIDSIVAGGIGDEAAVLGEHIDTGSTAIRPEPEFERNERTFEGDGRHALEDQ